MADSSAVEGSGHDSLTCQSARQVCCRYKSQCQLLYLKPGMWKWARCASLAASAIETDLRAERTACEMLPNREDATLPDAPTGLLSSSTNSVSSSHKPNTPHCSTPPCKHEESCVFVSRGKGHCLEWPGLEACQAVKINPHTSQAHCKY